MVLSLYLGRESYDFNEIWCVDTNVDSKNDHVTKYRNFANSKWLTVAILKIVISYISTIYCPINQARSQDCQNEEADRSSAPSLPSPPSPSLPPLLSPPFPSPSVPYPPLPLEVGPLNPARGSGERCKLPQRGLGRSPSRNRFWCILALKSGIWCRPQSRHRKPP